MDKITVKNISTATVGLIDNETRFNRELLPNREIPISREQYENFTYDPGFMNLLRNGFIKINGLQEDEIVEKITESYGKDAIKKMYEDHDVTSFVKFIPTASPADRDAAIELARELKITDNAFTALIKKYCGVDIINAINIEHQATEK